MSEHRGREVFENLADGVVVHDPETGEILDVNRRSLEMLGYDRDELVGTPVDTIAARDHDDSFARPAKQLRQSHDSSPVQFELTLEGADGQQFAAVVRCANAEFDGDRRIVSSIRKPPDGGSTESGADLDAERRQYERMVETASDGIYVLDDDLRFSMVNGAMETITGYERAELLGAHLSKVVDTEESVAGREAREQLLTSDDDVMTVENQVTTAGGGTKPCEFRFSVFSADAGVSTVGVVRDITERKERERRLESYRVLFENTSDCIVQTEFVDGEPIIGMVNTAFEETFGYSEADVVGESLDDVVVPDDRLDEAKSINRRGKRGETVREEVTRETLDGRREFLLRSVHFEDDTSFAVYTDITKRKRHERELETLNTRLQLALEGTNTGVWEWNLETDELVWDEQMERLFGYEPGTFEGTYEAFASRIHPDDLPDLEASHERGLEEGFPENYGHEFRVVVDGEVQRWVASRAERQREDGEPDRMVGITTDITDRKEHEQELEAARRASETLIEASPMPIWVQGVSEIRYANEAAAEFFGFENPESLVGTSALSYVPEDQRDRTRERNETLLSADERTGETTGTVETVDGQRREAVFAAAPITYYGDRAIVTIAKDITERKQRERELRKTKEELEASNERLQQFAYVASHDLQEPLRMVSSYVELLEMELGDTLTDEQREYMEFAVDGAERMKAMIDGLLQYSRVQTQADPFEQVDAGDVVEETLQDLSLRVEEADAEVKVGELPTVTADRNQLGQVFQNLLKNALEHGGPAPTVEVTATEHDDRVEFAVSDDGPGIPERQRESIFDIFDTGSDSDGTGIGLAVCKRIVDRHDGDIRVESAEGDGTTFYVTIPDDPGSEGQSGPGSAVGESA